MAYSELPETAVKIGLYQNLDLQQVKKFNNKANIIK